MVNLTPSRTWLVGGRWSYVAIYEFVHLFSRNTQHTRQ
jgi:hypothetical protein